MRQWTFGGDDDSWAGDKDGEVFEWWCCCMGGIETHEDYVGSMVNLGGFGQTSGSKNWDSLLELLMLVLGL